MSQKHTSGRCRWRGVALVAAAGAALLLPLPELRAEPAAGMTAGAGPGCAPLATTTLGSPIRLASSTTASRRTQKPARGRSAARAPARPAPGTVAPAAPEAPTLGGARLVFTLYTCARTTPASAVTSPGKPAARPAPGWEARGPVSRT
jgi:hypothetical protein